ncbi:MAG: right-handed parallel beta-helix repeat-containing protein [Bryobacteraceae bacterium]
MKTIVTAGTSMPEIPALRAVSAGSETTVIQRGCKSIGKLRFSHILRAAALSGLLSFGLAHAAMAKTWCVNPGGTSGCSSTIGAAVLAAAANDQIMIGAGEYAEAVVLTKPLGLIGAGPDATIVNAHGLANGIYVDGLDNPGMSGVLITGLTVINANYEGILVTNTTDSLISNNHVASNDQSLNYANGTCAGQPVFETNEGDDCGEGIHLMGTFGVTVANNVVELNAGGILLSDETGQNYENLITGNSVHDNALDCGITLASHAPSPKASSTVPYGVFSNTVIGNTSSGNGIIGSGAGVGIFAPGPGNLNFGNKIIGNIVLNNGASGIAMHNHAAPAGAPGANLNDNVIIGNYISGNGSDTKDASTSGPVGINVYSVAPIYQTQIMNNTIQNEALDVELNAPGSMDVHLNNLLGSGAGVTSTGKGTINATMNYFGCAGGAGSSGCSTASGTGVTSTPGLSSPVSSAAPVPSGNGQQ